MLEGPVNCHPELSSEISGGFARNPSRRQGWKEGIRQLILLTWFSGPAKRQTMISVEVRKLVKTFGSTAALQAIDIDVEPGELFFLLGPSGCGKTTLLRCLAGFYIPDSGRILFGDEEVTNLPPHKRKTGMVFQSYALWPHMTVAQNVGFGLEQLKKPRAEIDKQVAEALDSIHMLPYAGRKPNQLSGGQQQRVALARALVVRPRCLLLDEPLSNLDAKLRLEMRVEIRRVCKQYRLTTIYVTHDQKEALSIADRIAILHNGRILQSGAPQEIYRRPRNRFVADFIGETNFITGKVIRCGGGLCLTHTPLGEIQGILGHPDNEPAEGSEVTLSIRPECCQLTTLPIEENCFPGAIGETTYYGEVARYQFQSGEMSLKIFELNPRYLVHPAGNDLYAWVATEDVVVLND